MSKVFSIMPIGSKNPSFTFNFDEGQILRTCAHCYGQNTFAAEKWLILLKGLKSLIYKFFTNSSRSSRTFVLLFNCTADVDGTLRAHRVQSLGVQRPIATIADSSTTSHFPKRGCRSKTTLILHCDLRQISQ